MLVDPRVAHGRAKAALEARNIPPAEWDRRIADLFLDAIHGAGASRRPRDLRRKAVPRLVKALHREKLLVFDDPLGDGAQLLCFSRAVTATEGLRESRHHLDLETGCITVTDLLVITPHAIARCMQRNGTDRYEDVVPELRAACDVSPLVLIMANGEGWAQVGIPTPKGLFVGGFESTGALTAKTYFVPGANGQRSRWDRYFRYFQPMPDMGNGWDSDCPAYVDRMLDAADVPLATRFPFLLEPYSHAEDPEASRWPAPSDRRPNQTGA